MKEVPIEMLQGIYKLEVPFLPGVGEGNLSSTLCYLVRDGDGWLMVDCGFNEEHAFNAFRQQLDVLGIPVKDIRWLFVTHYHPDHSGLAARIKAVSGARVIIHQDDWNVLKATVSSVEIWNIHGLVEWAKPFGVPPPDLATFQERAAFGRAFFPRGLEPDIILQGKENMVGEEGRLRAILTPGHTPGHICLYDEQNRVLFSGDHVLVGITPHISPSHLTSYNQLGQYLDALRKVQCLDVDLVLPAHERPFDYLARRVDEILEHHRNRLDEMVVALSGCPLNPWDLAMRVHWDVGTWDQMDAINRMLAMRETLAHLELLESRGQVAMVARGGLNLYKLTDASA